MYTKGVPERYGEADVQRMAENLLAAIAPSASGATIVGLTGELGAGKTTLVKALAELLAIEDDVQSPTFVVMKSYQPNAGPFKKLVHMDAYRIDSIDELQPLRFADVLQEPGSLIVIEWPERIEDALPPDAIRITIDHDGDARTITYAND